MNWKQFFIKNKAAVETVKIAKGKRLSDSMVRQRLYRTELAMSSLKRAVDAALDPEHPDRYELYEIYMEVCKDAHLLSQMRTAINKVKHAEYIVTSDNSETEMKDKMKLIDVEWFTDFIEYAVDAEFWGHSLIEFSKLNADGLFDSVSLIPRPHVKPELGLFLIRPTDYNGIDYRTAATELGLMEVGNNYNLGLLEIAAREVIWKNYCRSDWSQASERYGMPILAIKTDSDDQKEIDKKEEMARNFGSNGYIIMHKDDEVDIKETSKSDFYQIYKEKAMFCDEQISKLINGQTGSTDPKAFVGAANVHERVQNDYTRARLTDAQFLVNQRLFPFLISNGYPLQNCVLRYKDLMEQPEMNTSMDNQNNQNDPNNQNLQKKKSVYSSLLTTRLPILTN